MGRLGQVLMPIVIAAVLLETLVGCGNIGTPGSPAGDGKPAVITRANASERCAHVSPGERLRVEHLVFTRLRVVRRWVASTRHINWKTFSADLAHAPLREHVAVCVVAHANGTPITPPGDSHKFQSALIIVSPTGVTVFEAGDATSLTWDVREGLHAH